MVLCEKDCIPCCDFCIYAIHDRWEENGKEIVGNIVPLQSEDSICEVVVKFC